MVGENFVEKWEKGEPCDIFYVIHMSLKQLMEADG